MPRPIHFDPQRRAASGQLKAAIERLTAVLERHEADLSPRQRARKAGPREGFALAVEALACNLAIIAMLDLDAPLAVPRKASVMWSAARYRPPVYGKHFLTVLDLMADPRVALIERVATGYRFAGRPGLRTTYRPTLAFLEHIPLALLSWAAFGRAEEPEVLILKGLKDPKAGQAPLMDYPETATTHRLRQEVLKINAFLSKARIVLLDGGPGDLDEEGQPLDPSRLTLRRSFNGGSWFSGGRLWGGFWETMPREDRFRLIRIGTRLHPEGERTASVDLGQLYPRLLYLREGLTPPEEDLYDIDGDGSCRDGWKRLVNAMAHAPKRLTHLPKGAQRLFPEGARPRDLINRVEKRHAPIAHLFGIGIGQKLALQESTMLILALLDLQHRGVVGLPLHDSVIVGASEVQAAQGAMTAAFRRLCGSACAKLSVDFG